MTTIEKKRRRWKSGESGNPKGRRPGTGKIAKLRENIAEHMPEIINQMVSKAKEGDAQAARLLMERVIPQIKPMEQLVEIDLSVSADLSTQGQSIIHAVTDGILASGQGSALITSLGTLAKIKEIDELEKRLAALE